MHRTSTLLTVINAITSNQMKHDNGSCDRNFTNCVTRPEKKFRTRGIKTRELVLLLYYWYALQVSYETADVESRSILDSYASLKSLKPSCVFNKTSMFSFQLGASKWDRHKANSKEAIANVAQSHYHQWGNSARTWTVSTIQFYYTDDPIFKT